ncbi:response regulator [Sphingomonas sp. JC676]|uniref:response regulator n=1 Tax=Sphingomonas sp. JC676 TaxID=2768065 RepID=UPI001657BE6F|nr:response regulator [Sphingomonas sp. JC676]MBC9031789.1 response regulator [Sphingomonas sp. JC676]
MPGASNILIVEDEPLIAMMLEDFLEALDRGLAGSADTVSAALELIEQGGVDMAILDVNLRGGEQSWPVADRLSELNIPFVIATGGAGDSIAEAHRGRPILSKPFTMSSVEAVLDALQG